MSCASGLFPGLRVCGGVFSRSQTHTFFRPVILMHNPHACRCLAVLAKLDFCNLTHGPPLSSAPSTFDDYETRRSFANPPARGASRPPRALSPSSSRPSGIASSASSRHALHLLLSRWCSHRPPPPALLAAAPPALVLADAWPRALPAVAPNALVVADASAAALLAPAPDVLVLSEAPAPALPVHAPDAPGRTDARSPALLA